MEKVLQWFKKPLGLAIIASVFTLFLSFIWPVLTNTQIIGDTIYYINKHISFFSIAILPDYVSKFDYVNIPIEFQLSVIFITGLIIIIFCSKLLTILFKLKFAFYFAIIMFLSNYLTFSFQYDSTEYLLVNLWNPDAFFYFISRPLKYFANYNWDNAFKYGLINFILAFLSLCIVNYSYLISKTGIKNLKISNNKKYSLIILLLGLIFLTYYNASIYLINKIHLKMNIKYLYGFIDKTGKMIAKPQYLYAKIITDNPQSILEVPSYKEWSVMDKNGKWGIFDDSGKMLVKPAYDSEFSRQKGYFLSTLFGKTVIIDSKGHIVLENLDRNLNYIIKDQGVIIFSRNTKSGIADLNGKIIIKPEFAYIAYIKNGQYLVQMKHSNSNNKDSNLEVGVIDKTGKLLVKPIYQKIQFNYGGPLAAKKDNKWGFINQAGKTLVKPIFQETLSAKNAFIAVKQNNKWGLIDNLGNYIVKPLFNFINITDSLNTKLIPVKTKDLWGFINKKGEFIIPPKYKFASSFNNGLAIIALGKINDDSDSKYGIIDETGKYIVNPQFDSVSFINDELILVKKDNKTGVLNINGKYLIKPEYDSIQYESNHCLTRIILPSNIPYRPENDLNEYNPGSIFVVTKNFHIGYIDHKGKIIAKPQFDSGWKFSEGLAVVEMKNKWGFIDKSGKIVIKPQFDEVKSFSEGLAVVKINNKWGFIDKSGKIIINPQFAGVSDFHNNIAYIVMKQKI